MKIYASDLTDVTEVLTGDLLHIKDANTAGAAATSGLRIEDGNVNLFLDGTGKQEIHTNTISGRIPIAIDPADIGSSSEVFDGNPLTVTTGGAFVNSSIAQGTDGHVTIQNSDGTAPANLTISGNLIVQGATTNIESTNLVVEDKYIQVNRALADDGVTPATTTADGGVLVTRAVAGEQPTGAASNALGTHAGIRYNESDSRWEVATAVPDTGGADGDWTALPLTAGNAGFFSTSRTLASSATTFTILASAHGQTGSTFSIQVYDVSTANLKTQIIPQNITVGTDSSGVGATLEGTITVTMPADTANARTFHIAVTG